MSGMIKNLLWYFNPGVLGLQGKTARQRKGVRYPTSSPPTATNGE